MLHRLLHFIKYHNAFPIGVSIFLLSFGGVLAASPEVRHTAAAAVYTSEEEVVATDNTYLLSLNLKRFTPSIQILGVTEDGDSYYVTYRLKTVGIEEYVWREVTREGVLQVSKIALAGMDLGLYATEELKEIADRELALLNETKDIEAKHGVSHKVVATKYKGLVGKFLDVKEERFPGYRPVVKPPAPPQLQQDAPPNAGGTPPEDPQSGGETDVDVTPPQIVVMGDNPFYLLLGEEFSDPGVVTTDDRGGTVHVDVSGTVDTTGVGDYHITYTARDGEGNAATAERLVTVLPPPDTPAEGTDPEENPAPQEEPLPEETPDNGVEEPFPAEEAPAPETPVEPETENTDNESPPAP